MWRWRRLELLGYGFTQADARLISESREVDMARVRELMARGCSAETAARILR